MDGIAVLSNYRHSSERSDACAGGPRPGVRKGEGAARRSLRILFASPEIFPLAKTGGLGDVSAALPAARRQPGCPGAVRALRVDPNVRKCGSAPFRSSARSAGWRTRSSASATRRAGRQDLCSANLRRAISSVRSSVPAGFIATRPDGKQCKRERCGRNSAGGAPRNDTPPYTRVLFQTSLARPEEFRWTLHCAGDGRRPVAPTSAPVVALM